jgi:hypothetical protein
MWKASQLDVVGHLCLTTVAGTLPALGTSSRKALNSPPRADSATQRFSESPRWSCAGKELRAFLRATQGNTYKEQELFCVGITYLTMLLSFIPTYFSSKLAHSKQFKCRLCHETGHYSTTCPNKNK